MMAQIPITKANKYNPILPVCNFLPCIPMPLATVPKLKTTFPKAGSKVVLKKLDKLFKGLTIRKE
jgi:hypothetical protein